MTNEKDKSKMKLRIFGNVSRFLLTLLGAVSLLVPVMRGQQAEEQKGIDQGNYNYKQSIEFGYRFTNVNGSQETYDTMVNLQQGPRLLGFTTELRSLDQHATFFDRMYFSNFGYGGDPNNVSQLRISKNKWYAFNGMFRKDQNYWDYSLLANPLNPTTAGAECAVEFQSDTQCALKRGRHVSDRHFAALVLHAKKYAELQSDGAA